MVEGLAIKFMESIREIFLGWIPDWVWALLPWWPWILGAIGATMLTSVLYRIYKVGGWPGLVVAVGALGTAVGYVLGSRTKDKPSPPETKATKKPRSNKKTIHRKTIFDQDGNGINDRDER